MKTTLAICFCLFLIAYAMVSRFGGLFSRHLETPDRDAIIASLKSIRAGLENYERKNGRPVSPIIRNKDGERLLSWRVAVLPYLGEDAIFERFSVTSRWNDKVNSKLQFELPASYASSSPKDNRNGLTFFRMVGTADSVGAFLPIDEFAGNKVIIVEATNPVPWTEPDDLLDLKVNIFDCGKRYRNGFFALFENGEINFVSFRDLKLKKN